VRRAGGLIVLLVAAACGPGASHVDAQSATESSATAEVSEAQDATPETGAAAGMATETDADEAGAGAAPVADADAPTAVPWPEQALPAFKALYAGSWVPDGADGFDEQWFDEAALVQTYTKRRAGRRIWRGLRSSDGVMPLDLLIRDRTGPAVGFVYVLNYRRPGVPEEDYADFEYADEQAILHLRHQGRTRLLFDGVVVLDVPAPPPGEVGQAQAMVTMTDGFDVLLAKVGRGSSELGSEMNFEVRLSDLDGAPLPSQGWNTMRSSDAISELVEEPSQVAEPDSDG